MFDLWLFVPFKFNQFIILKTCFFLNQYNRHFFFSKTFNSKNKFISTKNNQSIDQSTNTILKYLSLKKKEQMQQQQHSPKISTLFSHKLLFVMAYYLNTITQEVVMFLNNTLQLCFTTNPLSFHHPFSTKTKTNNIT